MKLFTKLIDNKDYDKIKHLNLEFKELNELFVKNTRSTFVFINTIGIFPKNTDKIGRSRVFSYSNSMEKEIEWAFLILKLNKVKLTNFLKLERDLFKQILFGNYNEALEIIEQINNNICYSQWSILIKMTVLYLKKDLEELQKYTNYLLNELDLESALRNAIFLHNHKLLIQVNNEKDFSKLMIDIEFILNDYESTLINNFGKEKFYNNYQILVKYCEKYSMTPFNKKSEYVDLQKLLSLSSKNSLIDLYKTFSMVLTELQQNNMLKLDDYVKESIHKTFEETNLIKVSARNTINKKFSTLKLLYVQELYLKGSFLEVLNISLKYLKHTPYSIDYIYLFVNSLVYLNENPFKYLDKIEEDSLLYQIVYYYSNILSNKDFIESLAKLKKILLLFGIQTQWSMYLYYLLFDFLCLQRNSNKKSFSKSLYFSYILHPRYFYNLSNEQKIYVINLLNNSKYKDYEILKIYNLEVYGLDKIKTLNLEPEYRGKYIISTYEKNLQKIEELYNLEDISFNEKIKVIIDYINILFEKERYDTALILMVKNMQKYDIPLCMFNYKKLIFNPNGDLFYMIEYIYMIILDNSKDMIFIHYAISNYLRQTNKKYNLPSRLAKDLKEDSDNLEIKLYLLNFCTSNRLLEEFVLDISSSKEIIEEQLKIYDVLLNFAKNDLEKDEYVNNINDLENKRISLNNSNYINKNKLRLNTTYIKFELNKSIKSLELFVKLPHTEIDIQELIKKMVYKYIPKIETKEDLVLSDLSKVLDTVINSEYGLFNEIEADIKHGFMEQRLFEPFVKEKLVASTIKGNYVNIKSWSQDYRLQNKLFEITDELKLLIENFKNNYISCNNEISKKNILIFEQKTVCNLIDIQSLVYNVSLLKEEKTYIDLLLNVILESINKLLINYRQIIEEELKKQLNEKIFQKYLKSIKELEQNQVIVQPVLDALNNLEENLNIAVNDVSSWFELYEETIHEHFQLDIILKSNEIKRLGLEYNSIGSYSKFIFLGNTYQMIYRIFFNIFQNVKKHSISNRINIIFEDTENFLIFTFSNIVSSSKAYNTLNLRSGNGENIIKSTVNKLNDTTEQNEEFVTINKNNETYSVRIQLSKKVLINE
ncbi:hypothetical protein ACN4FT_02865 [Aliarcobacter butzleri]|uniref:hypothetical protein n=1 Tax=Aliarcobacter butzleri TaxID=28197 RepID=UPI003AF674AC